MTRPQRRSFICGHDQPRQPDRGEQLLIEVVLQEFVGQLLEWPGCRRAGIVHDDVDLAERLHGVVVSPANIGGNSDVADDGVNTSSVARADGFGGGGEGFAPAGDDGDVGARGREPGRNRKPYPLAAAGNDGRPAGETDVHSVLPIAPDVRRAVTSYRSRGGTESRRSACL